MTIEKVGNRLRVRFTAKELVLLIMSKFFKDVTSKIVNDAPTETELLEHIKILANKTVDTTDYEFFTTILELYQQFERNCDFGFYLKNKFDLKTDKIETLDDVSKFRDDPPDVIVIYKGNDYEFELKRYRDNIDFNSLSSFLKNKIVNHYSDKSNYLILLQPKPNSNISLDTFDKLNKELINYKRDFGRITFTLNHDNNEMFTAFIFPNLGIYRRKYSDEHNLFADILHEE